MQLSLIYYSLGVTISFFKFQFENDTLTKVRCCHLLDVWWVFMVANSFISLISSPREVQVLIFKKKNVQNAIIISNNYIII